MSQYHYPKNVTVFEVGARDGLQNELCYISLDTKIEFVQRLLRSGVSEFELGAFVRADRVPQMKDTEELFKAINGGKLKLGRARAWALVPNEVGLKRAIEAKSKSIAVFTAASDSFNKKNIGMDIKHSLAVIADVVSEAKRQGILVRGYVSTVFGCPFEGKIPAKKALKVVEALGALGVTQVSIGDTIGVADPLKVEEVVRPALKILGVKRTALHFHDTRGTALANALRALDLGVTTFDASAGVLGGCPYAPGATGNLATEDLIYMLNGLGVRTGITLSALCETSLWMAGKMNRPISSRYLAAFRAAKARTLKGSSRGSSIA